ncbi:helix-turn-helix transcriptional regulator [Alkalimarinus coralli]|uniref:helix-turn-helix transcriptional regulator n=1 Tax=Alkalimarinus coralli TaxID=2935863 RepID=UPI00202B8003|nr:AraC family transcriptional regulator [Alkalimarinus coralli]
MSLDQAKVVSKVVRGLVNHLAKKRLSRDVILRQLNISESDLNNPDYFFPLTVYNSLYRFGEQETGDRYLGLAFGADSDPDVGSEFGLIASTCDTVADVLKYQLRFSVLVRNFDQFELITEGDDLLIRWSSEAEASFHLVEEIFARRSYFIHKYVLSSDQEIFKEVHFSHGLNGRDKEHVESLLGCSAKFDQPFDQIICNKASLSYSLKSPDRDLRHFYERLAQKKLVAQSHASIVDKVSRLLKNALPDVLSLDHLSKDLSVSPRTLQRQLQKNGYTLKELYTEVKRTVALESLRAGHSLMAISIKLGFSEQSAFQRAFKRWQGCTPKEFQQLYQNDSGTDCK